MISYTIRHARTSPAFRRPFQQRSLASAVQDKLHLEHIEGGEPGLFKIATFNKISPVGMAAFPESNYTITKGEDADSDYQTAHAIMIRSHKLKVEEVPLTTRAIARCGAGTNNIPTEEMTENGIPVFNTPGANANAVKELVLCGLLLGSRRIVDGVNHMKKLGSEGIARERVEKDKAMFGGQEIKGKTLGVVGLGHIGASTARSAAHLGMKVVGYDPNMSIGSALKLPSDISLEGSMANVFAKSDYISLNIPYIKGSPKEGGTHGIIGAECFMSMKENAVLLNFARGELVDSDALASWFSGHGSNGRYISDFPDDVLWDHPNTILLPHLGASTEEAEDAAATMASKTLQLFLETGQIQNSVNFPEAKLDTRVDTSIRIAIVNRNQSGVLSSVLDILAKANMNILQQLNTSKGNVAYNVIDVEFNEHITGDAIKSWASLQKELTMVDNVISTRFMNDVYGTGYAKNIDGSYYV